MICIACFTENKSISVIGFALAIISGVSYAYNMVGIIFLNEGLTIQKIIGCSLVLVSTVILAKSQNKENE